MSAYLLWVISLLVTCCTAEPPVREFPGETGGYDTQVNEVSSHEIVLEWEVVKTLRCGCVELQRNEACCLLVFLFRSHQRLTFAPWWSICLGKWSRHSAVGGHDG